MLQLQLAVVLCARTKPAAASLLVRAACMRGIVRSRGRQAVIAAMFVVLFVIGVVCIKIYQASAWTSPLSRVASWERLGICLGQHGHEPSSLPCSATAIAHILARFLLVQIPQLKADYNRLDKVNTHGVSSQR